MCLLFDQLEHISQIAHTRHGGVTRNLISLQVFAHPFPELDKPRVVESSAFDRLKTLTSSTAATLGIDRRFVLTQRGFRPLRSLKRSLTH